MINNLHKKQRLVYQHYSGQPKYKLIVKGIEKWGDTMVARCKVITKGWYSEIYLVDEDFIQRRVII